MTFSVGPSSSRKKLKYGGDLMVVNKKLVISTWLSTGFVSAEKVKSNSDSNLGIGLRGWTKYRLLETSKSYLDVGTNLSFSQNQLKKTNANGQVTVEGWSFFGEDSYYTNSANAEIPSFRETNFQIQFQIILGFQGSKRKK
jgi:hypothetical protein